MADGDIEFKNDNGHQAAITVMLLCRIVNSYLGST